MNILMLGWELPPHISGGLGIASQGIAKGLGKNKHQVDFLIPRKLKGHEGDHFDIYAASRIKPDLKIWRKKTTRVETILETKMGMRLMPYLPAEVFQIAKEKQITIEHIEESEETELIDKIKLSGKYTESLFDEISKFALLATQFSKKKKYDVIHAHDWVVFKAGRMAATENNLPLFVHCHSTEYDRNGFFAHPDIVEEEKLGFQAAKKIFCVSKRLKETIVTRYKIKSSKILVVPNATEIESQSIKKSTSKKLVVFMGRFTNQKNPTAFIDIARDLLSRGINCDFQMIGDGYLRGDLEEKVAHRNLKNRFEFTGFLKQEKAIEKLKNADLLIVPSSSEPFGLVILEAIKLNVPVIAATGTGVAEFVPSLPEADIWDHFQFINLSEQLLTDAQFKKTVTSKCAREANQLSWTNSAKIVEAGYHS